LTKAAVFAWEALMTAGLGLTVYGAAVARNNFMGSAPIGIAAAVMAAVMSAGPYTGCVINPARALGPAIVFGLSSGTVLLYVAAQMAGGALAALLVGAVHSE
jgi:glycerol uptake facilitator-like aquaporin